MKELMNKNKIPLQKLCYKKKYNNITGNISLTKYVIMFCFIFFNGWNKFCLFNLLKAKWPAVMWRFFFFKLFFYQYCIIIRNVMSDISVNGNKYNLCKTLFKLLLFLVQIINYGYKLIPFTSFLELYYFYISSCMIYFFIIRIIRLCIFNIFWPYI